MSDKLLRPLGEASEEPLTGTEREEVQPLPWWFFLFVGYVAAQYDVAQVWPQLSALSVVVMLAYVAVWFRVLRRRARYLRAVLRSRKATLLVLGLFLLRQALHFGFLGLAMTANATYVHLLLAGVLFVVGSVGSWFDQWLVLRTLRKQTVDTTAG
ncbi:hypothetical protein AB0G85_03495 [Streptomyces sioyaensis]|uniref:hypothetical protein n=1 Tax=Streptomyces sioyaensis TaxID=67364 RepID=UPI0033D8AEE3